MKLLLFWYQNCCFYAVSFNSDRFRFFHMIRGGFDPSCKISSWSMMCTYLICKKFSLSEVIGVSRSSRLYKFFENWQINKDYKSFKLLTLILNTPFLNTKCIILQFQHHKLDICQSRYIEKRKKKEEEGSFKLHLHKWFDIWTWERSLMRNGGSSFHMNKTLLSTKMPKILSDKKANIAAFSPTIFYYQQLAVIHSTAAPVTASQVQLPNC